VGNPPEVTSDENSSAESNDSLTVPDVPISNGYVTKITTEKARRERPDFIAPATTNEVQKALVGKPLEKVVRSAPVIQGKALKPAQNNLVCHLPSAQNFFNRKMLYALRSLTLPIIGGW